MSVCSNASSMVSFRGDGEVDLEACLDTLYQDIQKNLNYSQNSIRTLARGCDDDDFLENVKTHFELLDYVECLEDLFSELKDVSKQVLGKPEADEKVAYKKMCDDRKAEKKKSKYAALVVIKE
jgi:hypothetical protein